MPQSHGRKFVVRGLLSFITPPRPPKNLELSEAELTVGSPGGTRTPDQVVTSAPDISARLGLSHHPTLVSETGVGRY